MGRLGPHVEAHDAALTERAQLDEVADLVRDPEAVAAGRAGVGQCPAGERVSSIVPRSRTSQMRRSGSRQTRRTPWPPPCLMLLVATSFSASCRSATRRLVERVLARQACDEAAQQRQGLRMEVQVARLARRLGEGFREGEAGVLRARLQAALARWPRPPRDVGVRVARLLHDRRIQRVGVVGTQQPEILGVREARLSSASWRWHSRSSAAPRRVRSARRCRAGAARAPRDRRRTRARRG